MKVLTATHSWRGNGAAVMLLAIMQHWIRDLGWIVDAWIDADRAVPDELVDLGVMAVSEPVFEQYDVVLVNTMVSAPLMEAIAPRAPVVLWIHEGDVVVYSSKLYPAQWQRLFSLPRRIIFQTPWQSGSIFRSFIWDLPSDRIAHVRNGLPALPEKLQPKPRTPGKARIVFLGGVYARKRPDDLVAAVHTLARDDIEVFFVGTTEQIESLAPKAVELIHARPDRYRLVGEVDRRTALEYVASADAFCLPSSDESQPISPLEAATLNVPCLLTDLVPYAGTWQHGVNCLMHPVGNTPLLRQNIQAVLGDAAVREQLVAGAQALTKRFSLAAFHARFTAEVMP